MIVDPDNTFAVADFHFDHANIIKYCDRPFSSVAQMNHCMLWLYHKVVRDDSLVLIVGDMAFGRGSRSPRWWLSQLKGQKVYIKGSHDHGIRLASRVDGVLEVVHHTTLEVGGTLFYLVHDPFDIPFDWNGWVIHGHVHNNRPFIDYRRRRLNVSVEAIDYKPVRLSDILKVVNK